MKTKEQLEAELRPIQNALGKLRDQEAKKEAAAVVGKCFKYRNCYSCPSKASDYWWMYIKVTGATHWPQTFEFQTDKYGHLTVKTDKMAIVVGKEGNGYTPITVKEFNAAWRTVQQRIARMKP